MFECYNHTTVAGEKGARENRFSHCSEWGFYDDSLWKSWKLASCFLVIDGSNCWEAFNEL
jgi:hypothetical protein